MRHLFLFIVILFSGLACASQETRKPAAEPEKTPPVTYQPDSDIQRFLDTHDPEEEKQILATLRKSGVDHDTVKGYLKKAARGTGGPPGLHLSQPVKHLGKELAYARYVPTPGPPEELLPMIVILHGMGGSGDSTCQRWRERLNDEFVILCPSYPMGAWWTLSSEELILQLILETRSRYPVDPNRIFLAGLSNGALGAFMIGSFYPDYFAGLVAIAGAVTEPHYLHFLVNLGNTPVYSIQGEFDPIFPIQHSRRIHQILTDTRCPVVYREHREKGMGHGGHFLPESEIPGLLNWLTTQKRESYSPTVRMVREANHLDRIQWARVTRGFKMAALQIPGPLPETMNVRDGKPATLIAVHKEENLFEITGKNLLEMELYLSADRVDFDREIMVTFQELKEYQGKFVAGQKLVKFHGKAEKDLGILLREFKRRRDPDQL
ncbi:MAG: hypothetical protein GWM98_29170, partial [Nitrospinaceae bacterium]|nr:hypothetical protein [Nitrospinaceae bacterium]NIR57778.1 hypothetical protein [Nitrospinaceae bacterium]NIS88240.1 hypothetical protein [Nitrospinaceae bacterium]NIT85120.1 hypothetical protein [Nitrospinaceae bacterium]NIU47277.1 hypothetical protein [Nitrospinaceae bacterium]